MPRSSNLCIFYPHWQGAGKDDSTLHGALSLRHHLQTAHRLELVEVEIDPATSGDSEDENILNAEALISNHKGACKLFKSRSPTKLFTLGGDCGMELAPIGWLNTQRQDFAVVWFDAHADMNSPKSSPSKTFHGMVLRNLLEGLCIQRKHPFPPIAPERLILAGVRDLDPPEAEYIEKSNIKIVSCQELADTNGQCLLDVLAMRGYTSCYIHIDPDVLSLEDFDCTSCPTPDGIRIDVLEEAIKHLRQNIDVIGGSLQEVTVAINEEPDVKAQLCRIFALLSGHEN